MASDKARVAKDEGNSAFKAGDYPTAIGHYTDAILADGTDHTFFLNRAAAYLKLGKSRDAERDCTNALALSPDNVKALFRRAQARRALENLDGARIDLDKAIALEPANETVKNEILNLRTSQQQQRHKQRLQDVMVDVPKTAIPRRRRVPIEIVEDDTRPQQDPQMVVPSKNQDKIILEPVSSRSLKQDGKSVTTSASSPEPQTFMDAKRAREGSKPVKVSGGIVRHTGNHTIVTRQLSDTPPSTTQKSTRLPPSNTSTPPPQKPSITLFQFTKSWECLRTDLERFDLIRTISPSSIPTLFQVSLEPELLRSILHTFQAILEQDPTLDMSNSVRDYLLAFSKVQRFGTVMLFMDKQERQLLESLHEQVNSTHL